MVKSGLEFLKFEIELAPRPANLPGQCSLSEFSIALLKFSQEH